MKYKYFFILFLAVLIGLGHITFSDEEINPLEDSATWWSQSVPELALVSQFDGIESELQSLATSEHRLAQMEELLAESRSNFASHAEEKASLLQEIQDMQREIRKNILNNENDVRETETSIKSLEAEIVDIQRRQKNTASFIRDILARDYKENQQSKINTPLSTLFLRESLGNSLAQNDTSDFIQDNMETLLGRQRSLEESLGTLRENLAKKILQKKHLWTKLTKNRDELKQAQEIEQNLFSDLQQKQNITNNKLTEITQKKMTIQAKIMQKKSDNANQFEVKFSEYEKTLRERFSGYNCGTEKSPACTWMNQYLSMEKEMLSKSSNVEQNFVWPLVPNNGFGFHFRDQKYYTTNTIHHEWVDVLTPIGIPVQAMSDGYILIKQNPSSTSPGVVIVKHPNGYMSVYIGMNPNRKPMFSRVSAGDSLWTTRQYSDHSNQNNIHIELYQQWTALDPLEKLDLSILKPEYIPARYGWKYIDDVKKTQKRISVSTLQKTIGFFYVEWESESDRQKKFLETYAASDFQDRSLWVTESLSESIDPTFVMCVWFAESTLGKNLTTDGNIGNVGNTDGGARKNFDDAKSGVRAIAAVVNNNWLWGYTTIDQLSGWWNPKWPIYASSRTNWHENIVKCMSAIKQKYVWNKSPFRLSQASLLIYQQEWYAVTKDS